MPGYELSRFIDLSEKDAQEYTCSICRDIFRNPIVANCCLQTFCKECIDQWLEAHNKCPFDRRELTKKQLSRPPRALTNLLGNLKIRCKFSINGCEEILAIDDLDNHQKSCHFEKCKICFCINSVDHNCVKSLLESKLKSNELINDLQNKLKLANEKISSMNSEIDNYLQIIQALSNDDSQEISFKSKTQSLLSSEPRQASQFRKVGQLQQTNLLYPPVQSISRQTIQSQNLGLLPETSFQSDRAVAIKTTLEERDEEERLARKKKLEVIMSRTRKNTSTRGNSSNETPN